MLAEIRRANMGMKAMKTAIGRAKMDHQGGSEMQQENDHHQADHDDFFQKCPLQVFDGQANQLRTIVGGNDLYPLRQAGRISSILALTASMTLRAFSPKRITMTPPATSPRPSNSTIPRRMSDPRTT